MFISVIIPTYNRVDTLQKCLQHITDQSIGTDNFEVIVVDDCSSDSTPEFCRDYVSKNRNIVYERNDHNKGLATTRNVGIRLSKGDLFVFLDNDLLVNFDYLEWILKYYDDHKDEKVVIVSNITYQPEILSTTNFGTHIQSRAIGYRSQKNMIGLNYSDLPSNYFAGGGSSCKRENAYEIGLFEEGLKKYGSEDELFGYRLKEVGTKIIYCPEAKIIHYDSNILPQYWKVKYIELGRYSLKTLKEKEPALVENSLYNYLMPIDFKDYGIKSILFKSTIAFFGSKFFRLPIEKYIFATDRKKFFYCDILFRYITMAWIIEGFNSEKQIEKVEY